jgi:uncharacterized membrane protein
MPPLATLLDALDVPRFDTARLGEHIHGHLGWLSAIALAHPAIFLRRRGRRRDRPAHLSVALSVGLTTPAGALGASLYPSYRERLRPRIFAQAPAVGYLFERKEHLAFGAIAFAWAGALAYAAATLRVSNASDAAGVHDALRKAAHWSFVASAVLAALTAALGTCVASYATF